MQKLFYLLAIASVSLAANANDTLSERTLYQVKDAQRVMEVADQKQDSILLLWSATKLGIYKSESDIRLNQDDLNERLSIAMQKYFTDKSAENRKEYLIALGEITERRHDVLGARAALRNMYIQQDPAPGQP